MPAGRACSATLGGLFTLHALYTRPHLFETYIAADPSIWWNGRSILQEEAGFLGGLAAAGGKLARPIQLLIENSSGRPPSTAAAPAAAASQPSTAGPVRDANALDSATRLARIPGLDVSYRRFDNESHGSMLKPSCLDALGFFLGTTLDGIRKV